MTESWRGRRRTSQILIVLPFYENLGKRLIKSPKVYLADSGLPGQPVIDPAGARGRRCRGHP